MNRAQKLINQCEKQYKVTGYSREEFSWGILRVIKVGSNFSIVIHPENWDDIERAIKDPAHTQSFKSETGDIWTVGMLADAVLFSSKGYSLTVDKDQLLKELA